MEAALLSEATGAAGEAGGADGSGFMSVKYRRCEAAGSNPSNTMCGKFAFKYIYTHIYIYIVVCVCISKYIFVYIYTYLYSCIFVFIYIYTNIYVYIYIYMYVCVYTVVCKSLGTPLRLHDNLLCLHQKKITVV